MQDRVIQTYGGIVHMDFDRKLMESRGFGEYTELHPAKLPPLYLAYDPDRAEISDVPHRNLRALFNGGDKTVVEAMQKFRDLTDRGREALMRGDWDALHEIMNANFDLRRSIMNIAPENLRMIEAARARGREREIRGKRGRDRRAVSQRAGNIWNSSMRWAQVRCSVVRPMIFES